jgi:hypothetical protein
MSESQKIASASSAKFAFDRFSQKTKLNILNPQSPKSDCEKALKILGISEEDFVSSKWPKVLHQDSVALGLERLRRGKEV